MLQVVRVAKQYRRKTVLHDLTFSVESGEVLGVVGPNGAGKSTLLSILAGCDKPASGDIVFHTDGALHSSPGLAGQIGYVPQEIALHATLTVRENLTLWARLSRMKGRGLTIRVLEVARLVGLADRLDDRVETLSGGMKRKINIAVALLPAPALLIMDEPTVGLDIKSCQDVIRFIRNQADAGQTIIFTTHHAHEVEALCDRVLLLNQGQLRFLGSLADARQASSAHSGERGQATDLNEIFAALGGW